MNQKQLESILGERVKFLYIKQVEDKWIITKAYRIPDEDFRAVTKTVKQYNGNWVSKGAGSHWYVPAGPQEQEQTQNASTGVDLDQTESAEEIKRAVLNQVGRAISILKQIEEDLS